MCTYVDVEVTSAATSRRLASTVCTVCGVAQYPVFTSIQQLVGIMLRCRRRLLRMTQPQRDFTHGREDLRGSGVGACDRKIVIGMTRAAERSEMHDVCHWQKFKENSTWNILNSNVQTTTMVLCFAAGRYSRQAVLALSQPPERDQMKPNISSAGNPTAPSPPHHHSQHRSIPSVSISLDTSRSVRCGHLLCAIY